MKRELIVHIGHGKTGTSYLQSLLAKNKELLKKHDFYYPEFAGFDRAEKGFISSGNGKLLLTGPFEITRRTIVSSEALFHQLASNEAIETKLMSHNCDTQVILYTRNVFEMLISTWGQYVKRGNGTEDINTYLRRCKDLHHMRVRWWIDASKEYGFQLKLSNYSNHKDDLFEHFAAQAFGGQARSILKKVEYLPSKRVNRSLTESEYKLQSEFNRHTKNSAPFISDHLVNTLPEVRSEIPFIDRSTHDIVAAWITPVIDRINEMVGPKEAVKCETYDELCQRGNQENKGLYAFTGDQIEQFVESISGRLSNLADSDANALRDIALKIENNKNLALEDAAYLMGLAYKARPNGRVIEEKLKFYNDKLASKNPKKPSK